MPAAPCISGSTTTAAIVPRARRSVASSRSSAIAERLVGGAALGALERVGGGHALDRHERPVEAVKGLREADAHRAQGIAVVGLDERDERRTVLAAEPPVLQRELERDLDRRRTGIGIEDAGQAGRRELREAGGEQGGRRARETEQRRVRDPVELGADGGVDRGLAVPVDVAPERRDAVQVPAAVGVDQVVALGRGDHERVGGEPLLHLGEGMPEVGVVEGDDLPWARLAHGAEALGEAPVAVNQSDDRRLTRRCRP